MSSISFVGLFVVVGFAMICLLVLIGLISLVVNPRTRPVGIALLLIPLVFVGLGAVSLIAWKASSRAAAIREPVVTRGPPQQAQTRIQGSAAQGKTATDPSRVSDGADEFIYLSPDELGEELPPARPDAGEGSTGAPAAGSKVPEKPNPKGVSGAVAGALKKAATGQAAKPPAPKSEPKKAAPAPASPLPPPSAAVEVKAGPIRTGPKELPPEPRPEWLDRPVQVLDGDYQRVVTAGPWDSRAKCDAMLPAEIERGICSFIGQYLNEEAAARVRLPAEYVNAEIFREQYAELVDTSVGQMTQVHALLRFDRRVRDRIQEEWTRIRMEKRLWYAGGGLAGVLLMLSAVYGYLKIDLATRGAYRGRLRVLSAALIFAVATAAGVFLARGGR